VVGPPVNLCRRHSRRRARERRRHFLDRVAAA